MGEDSRLVNRGIPWGQGPKLGSSDNRPSERGLHSNHFLKRLILVSGVGRCWPGFKLGPERADFDAGKWRKKAI